MKKTSNMPMPQQTNRNNGTLKGPKQRSTNSAANKPSGLMPKEKMACLDKGGKACID